MDRPEIVIRDTHRYGDDLTVPEAIGRLCGGYPVTVTVTDAAPPGGDPRGNPRHGFDITVRAVLGGQPELPPVSWEARTFETPAVTALSAETLTLASQLAAELETKVTCPGARITGIIVLAGPDLVIETAGAVITGARTGERLRTRPPEPERRLWFTWVREVADVRDRFRRGDRVALEHTGDPGTRLRPGDQGTVTRYDPELGQLGVRWDSGSTLSMLLNDGDRVRLITPAPGAGETGKEQGR